MLKTAFIFVLIDLCVGSPSRWNVFSSTTAYPWAHNFSSPVPDEEYKSEADGKVCRAVHVNMLVRHGSRYPTTDFMHRLGNLEERLLHLTSGPKYSDFVDWAENFNYTQRAEALVPAGSAEQLDIGMRTGIKFASLFKNNGKHLKFVYSTKERNRLSSLYFYEGLRGNSTDVFGQYNGERNGPLMRFFSGCDAYATGADMTESRRYEESEGFVSVQSHLQQQLGLDSLTSGDVYLINDLCAYDKFIFKRISFWCDLLSDNDRLILEYGRDIEHYYKRSYGHPLVSQVTCPLISDMFHTMDRAIDPHWDYENLPDVAFQKGYLAGKFMDGHTPTLLLLVTSLGLFKESQPIRADNMAENVNRQFKSSQIVPFSGNLAFVLYACDAVQGATPRSFLVKLFVNERPVTIPACNSLTCPYDQVREQYTNLIDHCDIKQVCQGPIKHWDVFSAVTPYDWCNKVKKPSLNEEFEKLEDNKVCKAIQVNMLVRHGARYPFKADSQQIASLRDRLLRINDGPKYKDVQNWKFEYTQEIAEDLVPEGEEAQERIGQRTGIKFERLFRNKGQYLKFVSSTKSRNSDSSFHFYKGLNESVGSIGQFEEEINGSLLRFFDNCDNFKNQLNNEQSEKYENGNEFLKIKEKLQSQLGLDIISAGDVYLINDLCAYDKFIFGRNSFWCDLLTDEDRLVLEYGRDIEHYYNRFYGHPLVSQVTCPLISDMFHTMDRAIDPHWDYENLSEVAFQKGYLAGKFMNAHLTTLLPVMAALGLYKDNKPLLATNRAAMENRLFRPSRIAPFSANLAFVLYACHPREDEAERTFAVQLLVNEHPVKLPGCTSMLCPYKQVKDRYSKLIEGCDITVVCTSEREHTNEASSLHPVWVVHCISCIVFLCRAFKYCLGL